MSGGIQAQLRFLRLAMSFLLCVRACYRFFVCLVCRDKAQRRVRWIQSTDVLFLADMSERVFGRFFRQRIVDDLSRFEVDKHLVLPANSSMGIFSPSRDMVLQVYTFII